VRFVTMARRSLAADDCADNLAQVYKRLNLTVMASQELGGFKPGHADQTQHDTNRNVVYVKYRELKQIAGPGNVKDES
jgi:hypothetical protein